MTVKFYLDSNKRTANPKRTVFMYITFSKTKRLVFHTGEKIESKYWDKRAQRVKRNYTGSPEINSFLTYLEEGIKKVHRIAVVDNKNWSIEEYKEAFKKFLTRTEPESKTDIFVKCLDEFIKSKEISRKQLTIKKYRTLKEHLINFQNEMNFPVSFERMNLEFYEKFLDYLLAKLKHTNNTVGKYISTLKTFLSWAVEVGYSTNVLFRRFKVLNEKPDIIYLTEDELDILFSFEFTDSSLAQVRDVFCFGCYTGQRFSDIAKIKREDIKGDRWYLRTTKTKDVIIVPLTDRARSILLKYNEDATILPIISHQKTNDYIKVACQEAEINEYITVVRYRGGERIEISKPKYEFVTTHTARRTFVTLSLEKGMRPEVVMKITGHTNYKTMQKYIKITEKVKETEMLKVWNQEKPLKVVNFSNN